MADLTISRVPDAVLTRELHALVALDRATTAKLIAHLAEFDRRRLYAPAGYPSMFAYCVERLRFSEGAAYVRIETARAARKYPRLLAAIADGRLHLSGIHRLLPHLNDENANGLIDQATHRTRREIEILLAERFRAPEVLRIDDGISALRPTVPLGPGPLKQGPSSVEQGPGPVEQGPGRVELVPGLVEQGHGLVQSPVVPNLLQPLGGQRFCLQVAISQVVHDKLREAQAQLRHVIPNGDVESVLERAFDALLDRIARRKRGSADRPRATRRPTTARRHIPAAIKREVWERDDGRCTFVAPDEHHCEAREFLEFHHVVPVARGGKATPKNIRLLCRTHNRLEGERIFGKERMEERPTGPTPR